MLKYLLVSGLVIFSQNLWATPTAEQPDRNVAEYNLQNGLGLKGYDPVGYFAENGGKALKGDPAIQGIYGGVTYHFSSEENKQEFFQNPTKYEPTYGGWCAWAMANEGFANIDPMIFTQHGDRMHFFIHRGAQTDFNANLLFHEGNADDFWEDVSGEAPRL